MKKLVKILPLFIACLCVLLPVYSYFSTSSKVIYNFKSKKYNFKINGNGGIYNNTQGLVIKNNKVSLPIPERNGYKFLGYNINSDNINDINNKELNAKWSILTYNINYNLNGGYLNNKKDTYNIEDEFLLENPNKDGNIFIGWTGSNGNVPLRDVYVKKGTTGNLNYVANWNKQNFTVNISSIIQNVLYENGLDGFCFSVWINEILVADHVVDYYNDEIEYGTKLKVIVYDREGYSIKSFKENTWIVNSNININPIWYDDISPIITSFSVTNLGYYDPNYGDLKGWNIRVYINGYDKGTGIFKYQTWLKPFGSGTGALRKDGNDRILKNVLYLEEESGRTFCAYAIDNAGNESERCETIKV